MFYFLAQTISTFQNHLILLCSNMTMSVGELLWTLRFGLILVSHYKTKLHPLHIMMSMSELIWSLCQGLILGFYPQAPLGWGSRFYSPNKFVRIMERYKPGRIFWKHGSRKLKCDKWAWVAAPWLSTSNCTPLSLSPTDQSTSTFNKKKNKN